MYGYCNVIANDIGPWIHILLKSITCSHACDVTAYTIVVTCLYLQLFIVYNIHIKNKIFLKSFWFSSHSWPLDLSYMCCYNVMLSKQRNQKLIITPRDSRELLVASLNLKKKYIIFVNPHLTMMKVIECKFKIKMEEWISKKFINCCNGVTVD